MCCAHTHTTGTGTGSGTGTGRLVTTDSMSQLRTDKSGPTPRPRSPYLSCVDLPLTQPVFSLADTVRAGDARI